MESKKVFVVITITLCLVIGLQGFYIYRQHSEIQILNIEYVRLQERYASLQEKYASLQSNYEKLVQSYQNLTMSYSLLQTNYIDLKNTYTTLLEVHSLLSQNYENLTRFYSILQTNYVDLNNAYTGLQKGYDSLKRDYDMLVDAHTTLTKTYAVLQEQYFALKTQYEKLQKDYEAILKLWNEPLEYIVIPTWKEVIDWLKVDKTNEIKYDSTKFLCGDFSIMLIQHAKTMHWRMLFVTFEYDYYSENPSGIKRHHGYHAHAFVAINTTEGIVYIEPQTDHTWYVYYPSDPKKHVEFVEYVFIDTKEWVGLIFVQYYNRMAEDFVPTENTFEELQIKFPN